MWQLFLHLSDGYLTCMAGWMVALLFCPFGLIRLRRHWKEKPGRIKWLFVGLSAWMLLALLTAIELGFALLYDTTDSFSMTNASRRWFRVHVSPDMKTLAFSNGTGIQYRDSAEFPGRSLPSTTKHVCLLGDSFTFGHGVADVEDRFSNQLGRTLAEALSTGGNKNRIAVSNLSRPGTDLYWVESVLQNVFQNGHRVDSAVYVMCLNDVEAFQDPTMSESSSRARFSPPTFLFRETYFFNWAWFRWQQIQQPGIRDYYGFVENYYQGEPWRRFRQKLREVQQLCESNHCRFSVAVFPFLHQSAETRFAPIRQKIIESCREDEIPALDLAEAFDGHHDENLTVNAFDAHPNEKAHFLVARYLATKRDSLLPDGPPR